MDQKTNKKKNRVRKATKPAKEDEDEVSEEDGYSKDSTTADTKEVQVSRQVKMRLNRVWARFHRSPPEFPPWISQGNPTAPPTTLTGENPPPLEESASSSPEYSPGDSSEYSSTESSETDQDQTQAGPQLEEMGASGYRPVQLPEETYGYRSISFPDDNNSQVRED